MTMGRFRRLVAAAESVAAAELSVGIVTRTPRFINMIQAEDSDAVLGLGANARWYLKPAGVDGFAEVTETAAGQWIAVNVS